MSTFLTWKAPVKSLQIFSKAFEKSRSERAKYFKTHHHWTIASGSYHLSNLLITLDSTDKSRTERLPRASARWVTCYGGVIIDIRWGDGGSSHGGKKAEMENEVGKKEDKEDKGETQRPYRETRCTRRWRRGKLKMRRKTRTKKTKR